MSIGTTIPVPPALWFTGPDLERIAAERSADAGPFNNVAVEQDPERARKLGNAIQAASERADLAELRGRNEYVRGMRYAARTFARNALQANGPAATWVRGLAQGVERCADRIEAGGPVPEPSNIRPEVPGD